MQTAADAPGTNATESSRTEAATLTNTATYFYVWDQVGSIRLVMDGTGAVVVVHDYEPYGVEILPNNPSSMPTDALPGTHLYTGQERDADTGLDNFHFRSYASTMGRFLSPDDIGGIPLNPQSFNLYAYVHGNPVNYNDPTGHFAAGLPPQRYYNGDPFGGLNFAPSGGNLEPESLLDALMDNLPPPQASNTSTQEPGAQEKQDPQPTAGQQGTSGSGAGTSLFKVAPFKFAYPTSDEKALGAMAFSEAKDRVNAPLVFSIISVALNRTRSKGSFGGMGAHAPLDLQLYAKGQFQGVGNGNYMAALNGPGAVMVLQHASEQTLASYYLDMDAAHDALKFGIPDPTSGALYFGVLGKRDAPRPGGMLIDSGYETWQFH